MKAAKVVKKENVLAITTMNGVTCPRSVQEIKSLRVIGYLPWAINMWSNLKNQQRDKSRRAFRQFAG